jgi:single-stranded DNA-binding protein
VTKEPEFKESKSGQSFFKANSVHDKDTGEAVWVTLLGFKGIGVNLAKYIKKGTLLKASGSVKTEEYEDKKNGGMGIQNSLFVDSVLIPTDNGIVKIDAFGVTLPSNPEETKATTDVPF